MVECRICTDSDREAWQSFVAANPSCGLYHHFDWKRVIESAYGHRTYYLIANRGGKVAGILPLVVVRSRLFGRSVTSLPYVDFGGVVAEDAASRDALVEYAMELGGQARVDYLELRQLEPVPGAARTATHKVLMTLELAADEDAAWSALSSERRNRVRRAIKSGLGVEVADASKLAVFYDIWTRNMRDLGSPPHSREFFRSILTAFADNARILLVSFDGGYIGAALAMHWNGTLSVPWVSSLREHFRLYPNNILYWEAMRLAISEGITVFDFGRSTVDSGTYEFKQRWGAVATPLHWQTMPIGGASVPKTADAEGFGLAVEIWKRIPVSITRVIGPSLRKDITA